jgi:hypothetical protein
LVMVARMLISVVFARTVGTEQAKYAWMKGETEVAECLNSFPVSLGHSFDGELHWSSILLLICLFIRAKWLRKFHIERDPLW